MLWTSLFLVLDCNIGVIINVWDCVFNLLWCVYLRGLLGRDQRLRPFASVEISDNIAFSLLWILSHYLDNSILHFFRLARSFGLAPWGSWRFVGFEIVLDTQCIDDKILSDPWFINRCDYIQRGFPRRQNMWRFDFGSFGGLVMWRLYFRLLSKVL